MVNAAISQVRTLLDTSRIQAILSNHVFLGSRILMCRILHFRYKPGKTWIASYALSVEGHQEEQIVYLRAWERRGSEAQFAKSIALKQDVRHIPELDSVAWIFPADRKLIGLGVLCDKTQMWRHILPVLTLKAFGPDWMVQSCSQEIVHYLPERSCMLRLNGTLRNTAQTQPDTVATFYGKAYPDEQAGKTYGWLSDLWKRASGLRGRLVTAQPLLYDPTSLIVWQLGLNGSPLNVRSRDDIAGAAVALAELHRSPIKGLPAYSRTLDRIGEAADVIATAVPSHREETMALIGRLRALSSRLTHRSPVTLHGDLHLKNFLVTPRGVALIDLDTLATGDPVEDLASFAAALYATGLAVNAPLDAARGRVAEFITAYEHVTGLTIPEFDLHWHVAATLTTERALRAVTRMKPDSAPLEMLISLAGHFSELAEKVLSKMEAIV